MVFVLIVFLVMKKYYRWQYRGLYWTYPDTDNHEEQRLERVDERAYTELCPEFKGTYLKKYINIKR